MRKIRIMAKLRGRPTLFTEELLETILDEISHGSTERECFRKEGRPNWSNWTRWKRANPSFRAQLTQASEDWCESMEAELYRIANDETRDVLEWEETSEGLKGVTTKRGKSSDNTAVQRDRLRVDTISRMMKWKMPQRYGDKITQEVTGPEGAALVPILNITIAKKNG